MAQIAKEYEQKVTRKLNYYKRCEIRRVANRKDIHHYKFVVDITETKNMMARSDNIKAQQLQRLSVTPLSNNCIGN